MRSGKRLLFPGLMALGLFTFSGPSVKAAPAPMAHHRAFAASTIAQAADASVSCDADVLLYNYRKPKKC